MNPLTENEDALVLKILEQLNGATFEEIENAFSQVSEIVRLELHALMSVAIWSRRSIF